MVIPLSTIVTTVIPAVPPTRHDSTKFYAVAGCIHLPSSPDDYNDGLVEPSCSPDVRSAILDTTFSISDAITALTALKINALLDLIDYYRVSLYTYLAVSNVSVETLASARPFFERGPYGHLSEFDESIGKPLADMSARTDVSQTTIVSLPGHR